MRPVRIWPLVSIILVICMFGIILVHQPCDKAKPIVRTGYKSIKPTEAAPKQNSSINLTDLDILQADRVKGWIQNSMQLYEEKIKLLKDVKMLAARRRGPECTKKSKYLAPCYDTKCKAKLPPVGSEENFRSLSRPIAAIQHGSINRISQIFGTDVFEKKKYVFLLAITSNHYIEAQAMIQTLHEKVLPFVSNYTFYVYDMGLKEDEVFLLKKYAKAVVRKYPFHRLPPRVFKLKTYTWKPILIQAHIEQAEFVIYADSSVRFLGNVDEMFHRAKHTGFLMCPSYNGLAIQTSSSMFSYFGDEACSYSDNNEYQGGYLVFRNEPFAKGVLLYTWVACALDPECVTKKTIVKEDPSVRQYSTRHRFDQSALTLILVKMFREHIASFNAVRGRYHKVIPGSPHVRHYLKELHERS